METADLTPPSTGCGQGCGWPRRLLITRPDGNSMFQLAQSERMLWELVEGLVRVVPGDATWSVDDRPMRNQ